MLQVPVANSLPALVLIGLCTNLNQAASNSYQREED